VNKVETGVRAVHIPSGLASESTDERSQHRNKETAIKRLSGKLYKLSEERNSSLKAGNRLEHSKIVRGNPVRVYEGLNFVRVL
jgi:peptide chain release factor